MDCTINNNVGNITLTMLLVVIFLTFVTSQTIHVNNDKIDTLQSYFGPQFFNNISGYPFFTDDGCNISSIPFAKRDLSIALIERGNCSFVTKVLNVQNSGYIAAIVYNNIYDSYIFHMGGESNDVSIHSFFISLEDSYLIRNSSEIEILPLNIGIPTLIVACILILITSTIIPFMCLILLYCKKLNKKHEDKTPTNIEDIIVQIENTSPTEYNVLLDSLNSVCVICNDSTIDSLTYKFKNSNNGGCNCNIIFHKECMKNWFAENPSCPQCRKKYV